MLFRSQTGLVGYVFPIGTQKQTYQVFDATLKKTMPFVYSGTTSVHGIQAYVFVENVTPTQTTSVTVPGSFVGMTAASVTLPEFFQEHVIYYVDPETGALIDVNEQSSTTLRTSATAAPALVLFDADLIATPATVNEVVGLDSSGRNEMTLLETTLPLVLGIVGGVALIAGIFLGRKPRDDMAELVGAPDSASAESVESASAGSADSTGAGSADSTSVESADSADAGSVESASAGSADSTSVGSADSAGVGSADSAGVESGQEHHSAEFNGVAPRPRLDGESQQAAAEAPEGERPQ